MMSKEQRICTCQAAEPMPQVYRFDSETDPDIDVVDVNDNTYKCHKAVLSQSEVLAKSFDPQLGFKESKEGVIALTHDDPSEVKAMLDYLYSKDYSSPYGEKEESLLFHVSVYTLGEIYAINGLKEHAKKRFWLAGEYIKKSHILASAIQAVYEATPESDKGLRDVVVIMAKRQIEQHMKNREFREMMDGLGQFGKDLVAGSSVS
ncbi:BTB/POZ domain containing protein [Lasiodiplodia theobromae]|uniref:BTB/POZ domain containing protein n=1 Tax=Lasiodiplodia theobromae TaxID=45133 RepID=UPI0015C2E151|nr:BTB/POZ domain containing protein [Lasiodiplodia theobromae]KAF4541451.1 BTB/POZ domain containing protein [Lasiodiplodia theobromae]